MLIPLIQVGESCMDLR